MLVYRVVREMLVLIPQVPIVWLLVLFCCEANKAVVEQKDPERITAREKDVEA